MGRQSGMLSDVLGLGEPRPVREGWVFFVCGGVWFCWVGWLKKTWFWGFGGELRVFFNWTSCAALWACVKMAWASDRSQSKKLKGAGMGRQKAGVLFLWVFGSTLAVGVDWR